MKAVFSKKFIAATTEKSDHHRHIPAPYLRKSIVIEKEVKEAGLTVCGLGFYRFWLSGEELTRGFLSPYITNPDNIIDYDTYDLTDKLKTGKNVLTFLLGNGMQNAFGGFVWDFDKAAFRSAPKMAMCLKIVYTDGSEDMYEADESFKCAPSPIIRDELRVGEIYDANYEIEGFADVDFDDSKWTNAIAAKAPEGKAVLCRAKPIVKRGEIKPVSIKFGDWIPGISKNHHYGYIYDFGYNSAGIARLKVKGKKGQKITVTFSEILKDGKFQTDTTSFIRPALECYPDYIQQMTYICKGDGTEEYIPSFTYFGFRYAFVEGITEEQATKALLTYELMNTELSEVGGFSCSDKSLNALQAMIRNSTVSNFWHFPNDCPHREKNGWTADAALSAEHTLLNVDAYENYYEWMRHISTSMDDKGSLPGIVPTGGWGFAWGNGPSWDQIIVELPFMSYRYLGKKEIIEDNMDAVMRYVNYLAARRDARGLVAIGLGDWCATERVGKNSAVSGEIKTPLIVTDSIMSMVIFEKAAFMAEVAGREEDRKLCLSLAEKMKADIRAHLVDFDTGEVYGQTQTGQAMALYYGIAQKEERKWVLSKLIEYIEREENHITTGVLGARVLFHLLANEGYSELAYELIKKPTPPSYEYFVQMGYTALPECFDTEDVAIYSKNHHFLGDISAFFIKAICGINYNPTAKDLATLEIKPHFISALNNAQAYHICPFGKIESSWIRVGDTVELTLTVPNEVNYAVTLSDGYKETARERNNNIVKFILQK